MIDPFPPTPGIHKAMDIIEKGYQATERLTPPPAKTFFVATYGDLGLNVEFFTDGLTYGRAVSYAMCEHRNGHIDSFTNGECRP
jgi:hypothetical protein